MKQLDLNFEGGLTDRFDSIVECVESVISECGRQKKGIAADLDIQPSTFSRMFSHDYSGVSFPLGKLERVLDLTKDYRPIFYLVEKYLQDPTTKRNQAIEQLAALMPQIQKALAAAQE